MRLGSLGVGAPFVFISGGHRTTLHGVVVAQRPDSTIVRVRKAWAGGARKHKVVTKDELTEWSKVVQVELGG